MRVRVAHVVVAGEIGGAERMLVDLASRPEETGAAHVVVLFTPSPAVAHLFRDAGLDVRQPTAFREGPVRYLVSALGPREVAFCERVLRETRAEVAQLHTFASQVIGTRAARRAGCVILRTEHSARAYVDPSCIPFAAWSLRRAHAVVAVSEHLAKLARARRPELPVQVVRNGVDLARFAEVPAPKGEAFTFALVGRLEPRKRVDLALEALALVPAARLVIAGDGPLRAALERRSRQLGLEGRVVFDGFQRDVRSSLARAHALLCSSREEGLGVALLEGMAAGRPAVSVPVGGVPEIVKDGDTGLLARGHRPEDLAEAMQTLVGAGPARVAAMGATARRWVVEHASVARMCAGYRDAYVALRSAPPRSSTT